MKPLCQVLIILLFLVAALSPPGPGTGNRNAAFAAGQAQTSQAAQTDGEQAPSTATAESTEGAPAIYFPEKSYQFENVVAGQTVVHDFIVQNKGRAELHITRVRTG